MISTLPKNPDAFFLDFDGVVIESVDIKTDAFYEIYLPFGESVAAQAKAYHLKFQGINRATKFREIHKNYLHIDIQLSEIKKLSCKFSELVMAKIMVCPLVDGIQEFLANQQKNNVPVFLLSATPHDELILITQQRNLLGFFKDVYGAPWTKPQAGEKILETYKFSREKIIFVGDSQSDLDASKQLGTQFLGRLTSSNKNEFYHHPTINNFCDIL